MQLGIHSLGAAGLVLGLGLFVFWYGGETERLRPDEIAAFLEQVEMLDEPARRFLMDPDLVAFLESDDGSPFYVVNLFDLREQAQGVEGHATALSGSEALSRFARSAVPLWATRASHPLLVATPMPSLTAGWDRITVVRFRSRRDWIAMAIDERFLAALPYRLAAAERNERIRVSARVVPSPPTVLALGAGAIWMVVLAWSRWRGASPA
ncbi:MAG: hypothetical protein PVH96_13260 [Gemmatimonadota bacterium]|jgi:hypothetical protein